MFGLIYLKNVSTLKLDKEKCNGCTRCTQVCPHAVIVMKDKKADIKILDQCMECGACAKNCSEKAITVNSGVGCAAGVINGLIKGTEPTCGCDGESETSACC